MTASVREAAVEKHLGGCKKAERPGMGKQGLKAMENKIALNTQWQEHCSLSFIGKKDVAAPHWQIADSSELWDCKIQMQHCFLLGRATAASKCS